MKAIWIFILASIFITNPTIERSWVYREPALDYGSHGDNFPKSQTFVDEIGTALVNDATLELVGQYADQRESRALAGPLEVLERRGKSQDSLRDGNSFRYPVTLSLGSHIGDNVEKWRDNTERSASVARSAHDSVIKEAKEISFLKDLGFDKNLLGLLHQQSKLEHDSTHTSVGRGTATVLDSTLGEACAGTWPSDRWPRQGRHQSHCIALHRWHLVRDLLCCNFMGQSAELLTSQLAPRVQLRHSPSLQITMDSEALEELHLHHVARAQFRAKNRSQFKLKKFLATSSLLSRIPDSEVIYARNTTVLSMSDRTNFKRYVFVNSTLAGLRFIQPSKNLNENSHGKKFVLDDVKIRFLKEARLECRVEIRKTSISNVMDFTSAGLHMTNVQINEIHQYGITDVTGPVVLSNLTIERAEKEGINFSGIRPVLLNNVTIKDCVEPCIVYHDQTIEIVNSYVNGKFLQLNSSAIQVLPKMTRSLELSPPVAFSDTNAALDFGDRFLLDLDGDHVSVCSRHDEASCTASTVEQIIELHPQGIEGFKDRSIKNRKELNVVASCNRNARLQNVTGSLKQFRDTKQDLGQDLTIDTSELSTLDVDCRGDLKITATKVKKLILGHLRSFIATNIRVNDLVFVQIGTETSRGAVALDEVVVDDLNYLELNTPAIIGGTHVKRVRQLVVDHGHAELPTRIFSTRLDSIAENGIHIRSGVLLLHNVTLGSSSSNAIIRIEEPGRLWLQKMPGFKDQCTRRHLVISAVYALQVVVLDDSEDVWLRDCLHLTPSHAHLSSSPLRPDLHCDRSTSDTPHCDLSMLNMPLTLSSKSESMSSVTSMVVLGPKHLMVDDLCIPQLTVISCDRCEMAAEKEMCAVNLETENSHWSNMNSNFRNLTIRNSSVDRLVPLDHLSNYQRGIYRSFNLLLAVNKLNVSNTQIQTLSNMIISRSAYFNNCDLLYVASQGITVLENAHLYIENSTLHSLATNSIVVYGSLTMEKVAVKEAEPGSLVLSKGSPLRFDEVDFGVDVPADVVLSEQLTLAGFAITIGGEPATFMDGYKLYPRNCQVGSLLTDVFASNPACKETRALTYQKHKRAVQHPEEGSRTDGWHGLVANHLGSLPKLAKDDPRSKTKKFGEGASTFLFIVVSIILLILAGKRSFRKKIRSIFSKSEKKENQRGTVRSASFRVWRSPNRFSAPEEYEHVCDAQAQPCDSAGSSDTYVSPEQGVVERPSSSASQQSNPEDLPQVHGARAASPGHSSGAIPKRTSKNTGRGRRRLKEPGSPTRYDWQQISQRDIHKLEYGPPSPCEGGSSIYQATERWQSGSDALADPDQQEFPRFLPREDESERYNLNRQPNFTDYEDSDFLADSYKNKALEPSPFKRTRTYPVPYCYAPEVQGPSGLCQPSREDNESRGFYASASAYGHVMPDDGSPGQWAHPEQAQDFSRYQDQLPRQGEHAWQSHSSRDAHFAPVGIGACPSWQVNTPQITPTSRDDISPKGHWSPTSATSPLPGLSPPHSGLNVPMGNSPNYGRYAHNSPQSSPGQYQSDNTRRFLDYSPIRKTDDPISRLFQQREADENFTHFSRTASEGAPRVNLPQKQFEEISNRSDDSGDEGNVYNLISGFVRGLKKRLTLKPKSGISGKTVGSRKISGLSSVAQPTMMQLLGQQTGMGASTPGSCFVSSPATSPSQQRSFGMFETSANVFREPTPSDFEQMYYFSRVQAETSSARQIPNLDASPPNLFQHLLASPRSAHGGPRGREGHPQRDDPPVLPSSHSYPPIPRGELPLPHVPQKENQSQSHTNSGSGSSHHTYEELDKFQSDP